MKVVALGSQSRVAGDNKSHWTDSAATTAAVWPKAFVEFLDLLGEPLQQQNLRVAEDQSLVSVTHGQCGAEVIWTLETHLPGSWRVSAFHSNHVAPMKSFNTEHLERADGIAVSKDNFIAPLAIQTADCLAVAMTTESSTEIFSACCFHAGWRGFVGGIQHNAMSLIQSLAKAVTTKDSRPSKLYVTIGPAIAGSQYPCGEDVLIALREHHEHALKSLSGWTTDHESAFWNIVGLGQFAASEKIFPDLQALMCLEMHALGVPLESITVFRDDTFGSWHWPSHRRAMAQGLPRAGRLVTHLCPPTCPQVTNHASNS
jgi:copper oxidase (laccase) domain-containing protein